ncbi:hypothetical protein ACJVDH_15260 [Pedobacter sp. AW1-32]|uniref:hypothetical protein n=1 Tax=Pedobacter sp. AW1-32 TaxID=3383026 RepID=UPI003FF0C708
MALLGVLGLYVLSKYSLDYLLNYFYHTKWSDGGLSVRDACGYLYRFSFYIFSAFAYFYLSRFFDEREQRYKLLEFKFNQELTDKARGKHHYGNSEIFNVIADGHFLYGSLNYLLSQTPQHDHNSREMLIGIADTLRYLTNRSDFTAPRTIQQEVAQMELRVRMRKIRSSDFLAPEIECPSAVLSKKIVSGVLLPLFESLTRMYPNQDQSVPLFKFSLSSVGINVFLKYPIASQSQLLERTIEYVSIRIDQQYGSLAGISRYQDERFSYLNIQFP